MNELSHHNFGVLSLGLLLVLSTVISAVFTASLTVPGDSMTFATVADTVTDSTCTDCNSDAQNAVQDDDECGGCLSADIVSGTCGAMCSLMAGYAVLPIAALSFSGAKATHYGDLNLTASGGSLLLEPAPPKFS